MLMYHHKPTETLFKFIVPGALVGEDLTVGASQSASTVLGTSGSVAWLVALTLILFILMAVTFNRWRQQRRQHDPSEADDVTSSRGGDDISMSDAASVADLSNVTVETTSPKSCHSNSAFTEEIRTHPRPRECTTKC